MEVVIPEKAVHCMALQLRSSLIERIKEAQAGDKQFQKFQDQVEAGLRTDLIIHEDGSLRYGARLCPREMLDKNYWQKLTTLLIVSILAE